MTSTATLKRLKLASDHQLILESMPGAGVLPLSGVLNRPGPKLVTDSGLLIVPCLLLSYGCYKLHGSAEWAQPRGWIGSSSKAWERILPM